MLEGIESIFKNKEKMIGNLKRKSYAKNTEQFIAKNGHFFLEMKEYIERAESKEAAAQDIGECLAQAVKKKFSNKRGKMETCTQVDLNFFMIYYVFPTILELTGENAEILAEAVSSVWKKNFQSSDIRFVDYNTIYESFSDKIWGIF